MKTYQKSIIFLLIFVFSTAMVSGYGIENEDASSLSVLLPVHPPLPPLPRGIINLSVSDVIVSPNGTISDGINSEFSENFSGALVIILTYNSSVVIVQEVTSKDFSVIKTRNDTIFIRGSPINGTRIGTQFFSAVTYIDNTIGRANIVIVINKAVIGNISINIANVSLKAIGSVNDTSPLNISIEGVLNTYSSISPFGHSRNGKFTIVSSKNASSVQECLPSPFFEVMGRFPAPGARVVPVTTGISITFGRFAPAIKEYKIEPGVNISNITTTTWPDSGSSGLPIIPSKIIYNLPPAKPLQPGTTYTVTITYGQYASPVDSGNSCLNSTTTWQFTTVTGTVLRYAGTDGMIDKLEVVQAVQDYSGGVITKQEAIDVVMAYFANSPLA